MRTKAIPLSAGRAETSSRKASRPPAEAPMPTMRTAAAAVVVVVEGGGFEEARGAIASFREKAPEDGGQRRNAHGARWVPTGRSDVYFSNAGSIRACFQIGNGCFVF